MNIQMQQSQNRGKPGESPLMRNNRKSIEAVSMESLDITQKKLEARVSKMSTDLSKKLSSIMTALEQVTRSSTALGPLRENDTDTDEGRQNRETLVPAFKRQSTNDSGGSAASSPRIVASRKQSIDSTADSMRINAPSSPRSRRSSVGSIDEAGNFAESPLALPNSPMVAGDCDAGRKQMDSATMSIGAFASSHADTTPTFTSGKKRHSFSSPLATCVTIDQSKAVSDRSLPTPALHGQSRPQSTVSDMSRDGDAAAAAADGEEEESVSTTQPSPPNEERSNKMDNTWTSTKLAASTSEVIDDSEADDFKGDAKVDFVAEHQQQYDSEAELKETSALMMKLKPDAAAQRPQSAAATTHNYTALGGRDRPQTAHRFGKTDTHAAPPGPSVELTQSTSSARIVRIRSGTFFHSPQSSPLSRSSKVIPAGDALQLSK